MRLLIFIVDITAMLRDDITLQKCVEENEKFAQDDCYAMLLEDVLFTS